MIFRLLLLKLTGHIAETDARLYYRIREAGMP